MLTLQHGGFYGAPSPNAFNVAHIEHHFSGCGASAQGLFVSMYVEDGERYVTFMPSYFPGREPFWSPFFPDAA